MKRHVYPPQTWREPQAANFQAAEQKVKRAISETKAHDYQGGAELHSVLILQLLSTFFLFKPGPVEVIYHLQSQYKAWLTAERDSKLWLMFLTHRLLHSADGLFHLCSSFSSCMELWLSVCCLHQSAEYLHRQASSAGALQFMTERFIKG